MMYWQYHAIFDTKATGTRNRRNTALETACN